MPDAASPTQTEIVQRPDPGLGRGKWEGSPYFIAGAGALVLLGFIGFLVWKGVRRRRGAKGS